MNCENCGNEHEGSYGSGRFCSSKCARGFSTREKRSLINEKVSKKLSIDPYKKICFNCGMEFETKRKNQKVCSSICAGKSPKPKGSNRKKGSGGCRIGGGRSKPLPYINWLGESMKLNKEEIEVAKVLDQKKLDWSRNWKGFSYTTIDGVKRKFYPDFSIKDKIYVEYKGWVTPKMKHKMDNAVKNNDLELIIIVGKDPRYLDMGITLEEFQKIF